MPQLDSRIDDYIAKAQPFAQPILLHLRERIHRTCPEVKETVKWGMPYFEYENDMLCSFAGFKNHCAFTFCKAALMKDPALLQNAREERSMGHLGLIKSIDDLPAHFNSLLQEAMLLNEQGSKLPRKTTSSHKECMLPPEFEQALRKHHRAWEVFDKFSYSHRKEYIEWITEAKTDATRQKRINQAVEWIADGKNRNWKYK
ncbi:MAG: YdeI/OmpD-associated family protein [Flavipsychrobacter sp.]|jgi:uncharacterized protein YdeI (YjbR/CyaY-like superfamily)|nr:YdeI/OmpD-associated family protein [Flavipsychrobacter sp.]